MIVERPDCYGDIRPSDYRRARCHQIVIHRNTAVDVWRARNPDWVGDDALGTALFHRSAPEGTTDHFRIFPYHYFVDRAGRAFSTLPLHITGQHAKGRNATTVGVAMCWDGRLSAPSDEVYAGVAECIAQIWRSFGYPPGGCAIIGHSLEKPCPGPYVDLGRLKEEAERGSDRVP